MIATGLVDRSLIRFCLGTAEGLGPAVTNVSLWSACKGHGK